MRAAWIVGVLLGLAVVSLPAAAAKPASEAEAEPESPAATARQALRLAFAQFRDGDIAAADRGFSAVAASAGFDALDDREQYEVLALAGRLAGERGEPARAHPLLVRASGYAQAEGGIWHARLLAASALDDDVDVARCVARISRRWPQVLQEYDGWAIVRLASRLEERPEAAAEHRELLDALFDTGFNIDGESPDGLWLVLARLALEQDHVTRAAAVARKIRAPRSVVALHADRRFDRVVDDASRFALDAVIEADLARARRVAEATPDRLDPRTVLQRRLLDAGRFAEALASADEVVARVADGDGETHYADFEKEYVWILDHRAQALQGLGRWDEAVVQQRRAARRPENGRMNVSQALNLAWLYAELGRDEEALEAVEDLGAPSPYGRMQLEMLRLMVAVQRQDAAAVERHLAFMREHRDDAVATYQLALAHADRADEAAALLIERLRSTDWRSDALSEVQTYLDVPAPPIKKARRARQAAVAARADVRTAIAAVGHAGPPIALTAPGF